MSGQNCSWVEVIEFLKRGKCSEAWDEKPCDGKLRFIQAIDKNRYYIGCDTCGSTPSKLGKWSGVSSQTALRLMLYFDFERVQGENPFYEIRSLFFKARNEKLSQEYNIARQQYTGIPTNYKGVQYRSRLEAKWACFFDLLGWPYQYEPYDLDGYIPDFAIMFRSPLLVEVKPVLSIDEVLQKCAKPISAAWNENRRVLIAGGGIGYHGGQESSQGKHTSYNIGWIAFGEDEYDEFDTNNLTSAPFMICPGCKKISTYPLGGNQTCVRCEIDLYGHDLRTPFYKEMTQLKLISMWQKSSNAVQYNKPITARV